MPISSLDSFLHADEGAGRLIAHARLLVKLATLYESFAPSHLVAASRVANYRSGVVVIHCASSAVAAKLRQLGPTLVDGFSKRGLECNGVVIKVQAHDSLDFLQNQREAIAKPLGEESRQSLEGLRDRLPAGALREAIEVLLKRSATK